MEALVKKRTIALLALAGLLVSGYLLIAYVTPVPLVCGEESGCHAVQASQYSSFFGIPTPAFGVLFYATLGIVAALEKQTWLKIITATGLVVSGYLTYLEAFVINAWCFWCVISALLTLIAFLLVWILPKSLSHTAPSSSNTGSAET